MPSVLGIALEEVQHKGMHVFYGLVIAIVDVFQLLLKNLPPQAAR